MKQMILLILSVFSLISCEKIDLNAIEEATENSTEEDGKVNVCFKILSTASVPFEQNDTSAYLCFRYSVALFQGGTRIKSIHQTIEDTSFGTISMSLDSGTYQIVAIAYNGLGNCTISSPEKITFYKNKSTDTFYFYDQLTVTHSRTIMLPMKRAVSMVRFYITDEIPSDVAQMKFYYTGGSSTFNAATGFGCVNSRQTEIIDLSDSSINNIYSEGRFFEIYTFPHSYNDTLRLTVTSLDSTGITLQEKKYEAIPVTLNSITHLTYAFFSIDK